MDFVDKKIMFLTLGDLGSSLAVSSKFRTMVRAGLRTSRQDFSHNIAISLNMIAIYRWKANRVNYWIRVDAQFSFYF